jgi:hypothetical protein
MEQNNLLMNQLSNAEIESCEQLCLTEEEAKLFGTPLPTISYLGDITQVLPFLYLGSSFDASNHKLMESLNIGWVLNVATECKKLYDHQVQDWMALFTKRK